MNLKGLNTKILKDVVVQVDVVDLKVPNIQIDVYVNFGIYIHFNEFVYVDVYVNVKDNKLYMMT